MAFTQMLSNLFLMGIPLSSNVWVAVTFFLLREISNEMDIPTRQAYTMAIVPPETRTAMASVTNLSRNVAQAIAPTIAGYAAQLTFLGAPFLIGGGVKLVYNVALYFEFRGVKVE